MATVQEYLDNVGDAQRAEFERIRGIVHDALPGVEEVISYDMPGFRNSGKTLIWIGVFKRHMTLFPGTIKFTPDDPLPESTITDLLRRRQADLQAGA